MAATAVVQPLALESIWFDKWRFDEAEYHYQQTLAGTASSVKTTCTTHSQGSSGKSELVNQIAKAREQIQNTLNSDLSSCQMSARVAQVEEVNRKLEAQVASLTKKLSDLRVEMYSLVGKKAPASSTPVAAPPAAAAPAKADDEDDDDFELFGSDDENDDAAEKLKAQRIAAYQEKKSAKPTVIAKSNIILDIKPWDDETDMKALENEVRAIAMEGLVWGASKLVPIAYGVKKLSISCVVVDDLVSTDDLEEKIVAIEDYVQSMDIAAFNKV